MSASVWATTTKISGSTLSASQSFTAVQDQDTFNITGYIYVPYTGALELYKNGLHLVLNVDWVEVSTGDSFSITSAATAGDIYTAVASVGISAVVPGDIGLQAQLNAEQAARILKDDLLKAEIDAHTGNIATNAGNIATNTSGITAIEAVDVTQNNRLTANETEIASLIVGQTGGIIVFTTYALLDAYTPDTGEENTSFKVTNDPTSNLNGYYSWVSGTTYTKNADLVANVIDAANTSDAVSGKAVFDHVSPLDLKSQGNDIRSQKNQSNILSGADSLHLNGARAYSGDMTNIPLVTDEELRVLLSFNSASQQIEGKGLASKDFVESYSNDNMELAGGKKYTGSDIYPVITDQNLRVILGFDPVNEVLIGNFNVSLPATYEPLLPANYPATVKHNHLISYGQSLSIGANAPTVISTSQPYNNITFVGGPRAASGDYSSLIPLVEDNRTAPDGGTNRGETICSGAANHALTKMIVENGISPTDHIVLASSPGHGGYYISQLVKGSTWYNGELLDHINNANTLDTDHAIQVFSWMQGESDANTAITLTSYRDALEQLQTDISNDSATITSQTNPVFCITYQLSSRVKLNESVALAQLETVKNNEFFFLSTPMYNMPYSDGLHLTNVGYKWVGAYVGRAYKQLVIDKVKPLFLDPLSSTINGSTITVNFKVPFSPLVLDNMDLGEITDSGFKVTDGGITATINSIKAKTETVEIVLSTAPTGIVEVRYALDYAVVGITDGAGGNLRDSCTETAKVNGTVKPLHYLCPHFKHIAIELGE